MNQTTLPAVYIFIHSKGMAHKSYLFMNQTTLVALYVFESLKRAGS